MVPALTSNKYDSKKPLEWMQGLRDYCAGRCEEIYPLLEWVERQEQPITNETLTGSGNIPAIDAAPSLREVSRQMWALLSPLVKDTDVESKFANIPRHKG